MHHRGIIASFGASSGFSAAALWETITSPSTASAVAFLGSAASTVLGWWLARRAEAKEAKRHQDYLDALNAAIIKRIADGGPIPPPAT